MNNSNKKYTCPCCGGGPRSHNLGTYIRKSANDIRKRDEHADILVVLIPLRNFVGEPKNYAYLKYDPSGILHNKASNLNQFNYQK